MTTKFERVPETLPAVQTQTSPAIRPTEETAVAAVEAHARASIESRYIMAVKRPRDLDEARAELMRECDRPGFAEAALYNKPIGKGVEGLSIRFAEAAIKAMRNIYVENPAIFDSATLRIIRVSVTDLENNVTYTKDVTFRKEVERRKLRRGQVPLGERVNSFGDTIYIVEASDDDLLNKEGALISKAVRTLALRLVPGWLQDECKDRVNATMQKRHAEDPDAAKRRISDGFAELGVKPRQLKEYLGHDLDTCSPTELVELRALWQAISDGEATWQQAMDFKLDAETGSSTDKLKEQIKNQLRAKLKPEPSVAVDPSAKSKSKPKAKPKAKPKVEAKVEATADPEPTEGIQDPDTVIVEDIATARDSLELTRLEAEINHRHQEQHINTERWSELMKLIHERRGEIAGGGKEKGEE